MKAVSGNIIVNHVAMALFGSAGSVRRVHAELLSYSPDRWGHKVEIRLVDGTFVSGRYSRGHRFNGTVTKNGQVRAHRSFRAA